MNKTIKLEFNKTLIALAGYDFGKKVFEEQVKDNIDYSEKNTVVLPDAISLVASSFIQGFYADICSEIGVGQSLQNLEIKSSIDKLPNKIKEALYLL